MHIMQTSERREKVAAVLRANPSLTQEELANELQREDISVTQSTLSRDLQELGIVKRGGTYHFLNAASTALQQAGVKTAEAAGVNLIVVKTEIAAAQRVGVVLDGMNLAGLVGTIAGDDTLFLAVSDTQSQSDILSQLKEAIS